MLQMKRATRNSTPRSGSLSRRTALTAGLLTPLLIGTARADPVLDEVVKGLVNRSEQQARLFNTGEMKRWLEVADPGDDFTLMQPFGGPARMGFDQSPEHLAALAANFRNGTAAIELAQAVASDDVVVLVYIERQEIEVNGLPKQDWSLRVTQVFQRLGSDWKLVHRHADPLVQSISLAGAAALAAGKDLAKTASLGA